MNFISSGERDSERLVLWAPVRLQRRFRWAV